MTRIDLTEGLTPAVIAQLTSVLDLRALGIALRDCDLSADPKEPLSDDLSDQLADGAATAAER